MSDSVATGPLFSTPTSPGERMPAPRKADQSSPKLTSPTGVANGQTPDADPRAQSGEYLTTAQGLRLPETDHSLKGGDRGPTLLEEVHLRENIPPVDPDGIPEL